MFGALGDLVPNPMDLVPGKSEPEPEPPAAETTAFSDEVAAALASVEQGQLALHECVAALMNNGAQGLSS